MRSGVGRAVAAVVAAALVGCGGGSATPDASGVDGGAGAPGAAGSDGGTADTSADAGTESKPDLATDFTSATDGTTRCPTAAAALAPADGESVIDDFEGTGRLDGRIRTNGVFTVKEQFDATSGAMFDPAPAIEASCGAAAPGAAHIRGRAADTGATFAIVFSTPVPGATPAARYDASGTTGISFRIALGDASASKIVTLQVNLAGSQWDYIKDVAINGTTWQTVTILWSDLQAAPTAPAFSPAALNQLVFPFFPDTDVDVYIDDLAFVK
jgi:hypothetical protein